jgi:hypothetical protein
MKFEHNGINFEISNLDHIVVNTVRRVIQPAENGKPARVTVKIEKVEEKGTRVWYRLKFVRGIRWAKYRFHGEIPDVPERLEDAVQWDVPAGIQKMIMAAMQRPDIRLWFSGTYCNIQICENWQEVQRVQAREEKRKNRARAAKMLKSPRLDEIIGRALTQSAAKIRQETIDTPFGPVPVMTIRGSGRKPALLPKENEIIPGPCAAVIGRRK